MSSNTSADEAAVHAVLESMAEAMRAEKVSVPFDMTTGKALLELHP